MRILWLVSILCCLLVPSYSLSIPSKGGIHSRGTYLQALKYDPANIITVNLKRPLGLSLEENVENKPFGVFVAEVKEGSAKASGKVRQGLYLLSVDEKDVKNADFDSIMDEIVSKPESADIKMSFIDFKDVYKGTSFPRMNS